MNIEDEINKILNDDQIDYSEDYADCLELMVRLRSLDENDMEYNHIYEEFSKAFSKLNSEEQKHIRFNKLKMLVEQQIANKNKQYIDTKQKVLVEGKSKNNDNMLTGRTDSNKVVIFEGEDNLIGKVIDLKEK